MRKQLDQTKIRIFVETMGAIVVIDEIISKVIWFNMLILLVSRQGIEPRTYGLRVRCSAS